MRSLTKSGSFAATRPVSTQSPILNLPVEILQRCICSFLPLDGISALALTCKRLYSIIGSSVFQNFQDFPPMYKARLAKSFFLRGLQKDRSDPSIYVCYKCLRFHNLRDIEPTQAMHAGRPYFNNAEGQVGFPFCRSPYMTAVRDIYARLSVPRSHQEPPESWRSSVQSPVHMKYFITCGLGPRDLFMLRRYTLVAKEGRYDKYFMIPSHFPRTANLEICRHVYFGQDHVKGDGSINDALGIYYHKQHKDYNVALASGQTWHAEPFAGFVCQDCMLEVEIRFVRREITITVWQHVGPLKGPNKSKLYQILNCMSKNSPLLTPGFIARVARNGGLKAGDLVKEWDHLETHNDVYGYRV